MKILDREICLCSLVSALQIVGKINLILWNYFKVCAFAVLGTERDLIKGGAHRTAARLTFQDPQQPANSLDKTIGVYKDTWPLMANDSVAFKLGSMWPSVHALPSCWGVTANRGMGWHGGPGVPPQLWLAGEHFRGGASCPMVVSSPHFLVLHTHCGTQWPCRVGCGWDWAASETGTFPGTVARENRAGWSLTGS